MRTSHTTQRPVTLSRELAAGSAWAAGGVAGATSIFWLMRGFLDKGQASLLYLPVVIACALRFGFGPAVLGAVLSFWCWNFFFLPPLHTFIIGDPRDWLSLFVFLLAAVTTARLAARARGQAQEAEARERETMSLYLASEAISSEADTDRLLPTLAAQIMRLCDCTRCVVLRRDPLDKSLSIAAVASDLPLTPEAEMVILKLAETACEHSQIIGFGAARHLWARAAETLVSITNPGAAPDPGVYVPLRVQDTVVGALHAGARRDGSTFTAIHQRLILTLSNHAGVVIARQTLAQEAAQAVALREADTLKDTLLSMVSHELRTPLAAIKATASGLLQQNAVWDSAARDDAARSIDQEADRLTTLVGNLLDLSRLEAGAWHPNKDWCDLAEIIGTALDRLPEAQAARIEVDLHSDLPLLRADYTQVALVITNLLENALKYAPGETPICVTGTLSDHGQSIILCVRDYGPGIPPGEEDLLFERFYRGRAHRSSTIHGTGLGLAICQAIIRAHGGRIWLKSPNPTEPKGAIVCVSLPCGQQAKEGTPPRPVPRYEGPATRGNNGEPDRYSEVN